jgi:hypothetical protein
MRKIPYLSGLVIASLMTSLTLSATNFTQENVQKAQKIMGLPKNQWVKKS